jgi:hypothetical protein
MDRGICWSQWPPSDATIHFGAHGGQCTADVVDHLGRLFPDKPGRKPQHAIAVNPDLVLPVGVKPRLPWV